MSGKKIMALLSIAVCLCAAIGCNEDNDGGGNAVTTGSGTYAGTWTGNVCGRGLTMIINQQDLFLSGSYTLTDPVFGEAMSGNVSSASPPATATLNAGSDRRLELSFSSYTALTGGFYKGTTRVCDISASR